MRWRDRIPKDFHPLLDALGVKYVDLWAGPTNEREEQPVTTNLGQDAPVVYGAQENDDVCWVKADTADEAVRAAARTWRSDAEQEAGLTAERVFVREYVGVQECAEDDPYAVPAWRVA